MTTLSHYKEIDGSIFEGGGQILRVSAALSALMKVPIHVSNIRAGRKSPGLRAQHLIGLELLAQLCQAKLTGGTIESTEVFLNPKAITSGEYSGNIKTAGSVMLLFQISLPCLLFAKGVTTLHLKGGTNADMAPPVEFSYMVLKPTLKRMGVNFDWSIIKRGYFPAGGGEVNFKIYPLEKFLKPITLLDKGSLKSINGQAYIAGRMPDKIAQIMASESKNFLKEKYKDIPIEIKIVQDPSAMNKAFGIIITATTSTGCIFSSTYLGKPRQDAKEIGLLASEDLVTELEDGGCVDKHLQDQLIIFMALAAGKSSVRCGPLTLHTETAIHFASLMTNAQFTIEKSPTDKSCIINCEGIGLEV